MPRGSHLFIGLLLDWASLLEEVQFPAGCGLFASDYGISSGLNVRVVK
jgi:hypothetical protein